MKRSHVRYAHGLTTGDKSLIPELHRSPRILDLDQTCHHVKAISIRLEVNESVIPSRPNSWLWYRSQQAVVRNSGNSDVGRRDGCRERHQLIAVLSSVRLTCQKRESCYSRVQPSFEIQLNERVERSIMGHIDVPHFFELGHDHSCCALNLGRRNAMGE